MQKIVNIVALASGVVSAAVIVGGVTLYVQKDAIIDNVKSQVMSAVSGALPGAVGGAIPEMTGPAMAPAAPSAEDGGGAAGLGVPTF
tara:strand:+ start:826 stop:1086 length:261 start_codon:yes stop_codon:yes gene_type:complete